MSEGVPVRVMWSLVALLALGVGGCSEGAGCTDVGGLDGIAVDISRELFVTTGRLAVEVCNASDCASTTTRLGRVPGGPVGREAVVSFDELGRTFEPGEVTVTVRLSDARGATVAVAERPVELTPFFPNGESCDGDGYVSGQLRMTTADRR